MLCSGQKANFSSIFLLRVTKLFIGDLYNTGKESICLVVMDEQGDEMQASVQDMNLDKWKNLFEVGRVYIFKNVIITEGPRTYKLVPTNSKMIIKVTSCIEEANDDGLIPTMKRYLTPINKLTQIGVVGEQLTDIIGVVIEYEAVREIFTKNNQTTHLSSVTLLDNSESTTCVTIWGNIAINMNTDLLEAVNRRSILLATHLRVKSYSNKFGLNTTTYSSIILNPQEFEEAKEFFGWHSSIKERDMDLFAISATPIKSKPTIDIQILTISDLLEKSQASPFKYYCYHQICYPPQGRIAMAAGDGMEAEETRKRYISTDELRKHSTPSDLWISIQGKVYDVTHWGKNHPGGELPLLQLSGQDATDPFIAYHPGTVWRLLDPFYVGQLSDYSVSDVSRDYRRLLAEFTKLGMFREKGNTVSVLLFVIAILFFLVIYAVVFTDNKLFHIVSGFLLGLLWIHSGWIGHDSGHHSVMPTKGLTRLTQVICGNCFSGICIAWWKRNHNAHHIACNSLEYDPDLQFIPLFAVHTRLFNSIRSYFYNRKMEFTSIARFLVSYQHLTFYPVMAVARVNLFAQSLILLFTHKEVPNRGQEILGMAVFYTWYPFLVSFLPTWSERAAFVLASLMGVGIQHVQFCLNHFSSDVFEGPPKGAEWIKMQTAGTLNIDCSPWMDWFHGGLQFQIEHHLFPRMPRCHYRRIAPLVNDFCKRHGLPYSSASFWQSNLMIVRTLKDAAMEARDLNRPVPKNLVWEAMNAHG